MKNQVGARHLHRQKVSLKDKETVCVNHYKRESELIRVSKNVVKRVRS